MKPFYKSYIISLFLFLGALILYSGAHSLDEKSDRLTTENILGEHVIQNLQRIDAPEQHLAFLEKTSKTNLPKQLSLTAQKHHLSTEKNTPLPGSKIEITLQGELDTDIFAYLQDLLEHFSSTLSLQEIGLFREKNQVLGKVIFEIFSPQENFERLHHD